MDFVSDIVCFREYGSFVECVLLVVLKAVKLPLRAAGNRYSGHLRLNEDRPSRLLNGFFEVRRKALISGSPHRRLVGKGLEFQLSTKRGQVSEIPDESRLMIPPVEFFKQKCSIQLAHLILSRVGIAVVRAEVDISQWTLTHELFD